MANIDTAIAIAAEAHRGQTDKGGQPYILHPLRLMMQFEDADRQIVAVLHDVIEDGDMSPETLAELGFSPEVVTALKALTRGGESYDDYLAGVAANPLAMAVKLADLQDNMRVTRMTTLADKDLDRLRKYHKAYWFLAHQ